MIASGKNTKEKKIIHLFFGFNFIFETKKNNKHHSVKNFAENIYDNVTLLEFSF